MNNLKKIMALTCLIFLVGCVSAKEHKARLKDISDLKQELDKTNMEKNDIETELSNLKKDYEDVSLNLKKLTVDKTELGDLLSEKDLKIRRLDEELKLRNFRISDLEEEIDRLNLAKEMAVQEKNQEIARLTKTHDDLVSELHDEIVHGEIEITQLKDKLSLKMVDRILFDSGSAEVKKDGKKVLDRVAEILNKVQDKQFLIAGHTDDVPISSRLRDKFPSNWELSTARATNVVRYLHEKGDIDPTILSAVGYSEYRPVASNETKEGNAKNRRIEIVLIPIEVVPVPVEEEQ
jgi:chemotaxis protein MotB